MNADTLRTIERIKNNRYWRQGETLGEGGWGKVYSFAANWNKYNLYNVDDDPELIETITAESDVIALKAFANLYHLHNFQYEIYCNVTSSQLVKQGLSI